jgi:hypothetical protein
MRRRSSPSVPKPLISTSCLTSPVLNTSKVNPLLEVSPNAHLSDLETEFFTPLRIKWFNLGFLTEVRVSGRIKASNVAQ